MRILLVEDHPLVVDGLRTCIGADHQIAHVIGNGDEVLPWLQWNEVDLVTLDLALPNRSGFELLPDIGALSRPPKVLVVSMHDHTHMREAVQRSGAHGFISKDATVELSRQAIAEIAAGGTWFPDRSEEDRSRGRSSRWSPNLKLTKRQSDVR